MEKLTVDSRYLGLLIIPTTMAILMNLDNYENRGGFDHIDNARGCDHAG